MRTSLKSVATHQSRARGGDPCGRRNRVKAPFGRAEKRSLLHPSTRRPCLALLAAASLLSPAAAQNPDPRERPTGLGAQVLEDGSFPPPSTQAAESLIPTDVAARELLRRAADAVSRNEWKSALSALKGVLDNEQAGLIQENEIADPDSPDAGLRDGLRFVSSHVAAVRLLAQLPPEGRELYDLLYGSRAEGMLREAIEGARFDLLRKICREFPLTRAAEEARSRLAGLALDRGDRMEALHWLRGAAQANARHDAESSTPAVSEIARVLTASQWFRGEPCAENARDGAQGNTISSPPAGEAAADWREALGQIPPDYWLGHKAALCDLFGVMEGVLPEVSRGTRLAADMDGHPEAYWKHLLIRQVDTPWRLPIVGTAVGEDRVILRTPAGCQAFSLGSLTPIWQAVVDQGWPAVWKDVEGETMFFGQAADLVRMDFEDYVHGSIALGHGLVVLPLRREVPGIPMIFGFPFQRNMGRRRFQSPDEVMSPPLELVALDAETGELRWRLDGSGSAEFGEAQFPGPALEVGDGLWQPMRSRSDLEIAVLEAATGRITNRIPICSVTDERMGTNDAVYLMRAGQWVVAQVGALALVAVDAEEKRPLWAVQYEAQPPKWHQRIRDQAGWMPTPPLADGSVIINARPWVEDLEAHDVWTGRVLWRYDSQGEQYPIAAEGGRLWLGGERFTCLCTPTGAQVWSRPGPNFATGRAIVSDNRILCPHAEGLTFLDSTTGEITVEQKLPPGVEPFTRLFARADRLWSISAWGVRGWSNLSPTVENGNEIAAAWRNITLGRPALAFDRLERALKNAKIDSPSAANLSSNQSESPQESSELPADTDKPASDKTLDPPPGAPIWQQDARRAAYAAAAALAEAAKNDEEALAWLQRASSYAPDEDAAIHMAIQEAAVRRSMGQLKEAGDGLLKLLMRHSSRLWQFARSDSSTPQAIIAARNLCEIYAQMESDQDRTALEQITWKEVKAACDLLHLSSAEPLAATGDSLSRLELISRLEPFREAASTAAWALALWSRDSYQFEKSEHYLQRALALSPRADWSAAWSTELYKLRGREFYQNPAAQRETLNALKSMPGDTLLTNPFNADGDERISLAAWMARNAPREPAPTPDADSAGERVISLEAYRHKEIAEGYMATHYLLDVAWDGAGVGRILLITTQGQIEMRETEQFRQAAWSADLATEGSDYWVDQVLIDSVRDSAITLHTNPDVILAQTRDHVLAISARTGKRLWRVPANLDRLEGFSPPEGWRRIAADHGVAAFMTEPGRIQAVDLVTGRPLWRADLDRLKVGFVDSAEGAFVFMELGESPVLRFFDVSTGEPLGAAEFAGAAHPDEPVVVRRLGRYYVGPTPSAPENDVVGAFDPTSRKWLWKTPLGRGETLTRILPVGDSWIGLSFMGGKLRLLRGDTGEVTLELDLPDTRSVVEARKVGDERLVIKALSREGGELVPRLMGVSWPDGRALWSRDELDPTTFGLDAMDETGLILPIVVRQPYPAARRSPPLDMMALDVRTGNTVGGRVRLAPADSSDRPLGRFEVLGDMWLVPMSGEIRLIATSPYGPGE